MGPIRVLVADDSALMRQILKRIFQSEPGMELVGTARDGEDAIAKARELRPDVITMDINMPKLDGVTALQMIMEDKICPVVMVSSLTQRGAATTFECLELGAFDFVAKLMAYQSVRLMAALLHIEEVFLFVMGCLEHREKAVRIAAIQTLREANASRAEQVLRERRDRESDEEVLQALTR